MDGSDKKWMGSTKSTDFYIVNELNWGIVLVLLFGCLGWIQAA